MDDNITRVQGKCATTLGMVHIKILAHVRMADAVKDVR